MPAPVWWSTDPYDANAVLHHATCFFVEIGTNRFGVTASHVATALADDRKRHPDLSLMISNTLLDGWDARLIDHDPGLDVATFEVSEAEVASIGIRPFVYGLDAWPPPPPVAGQGVVFTGYPGADTRAMGRKLDSLPGRDRGRLSRGHRL